MLRQRSCYDAGNLHVQVPVHHPAEQLGEAMIRSLDAPCMIACSLIPCSRTFVESAWNLGMHGPMTLQLAVAWIS